MKRADGLREDWLIDPSCKVLQNPDHFCFNSDSAALAQFVRVAPDDRVLEIGTNNGALLVYLDRYHPSFLCGIEISQEAAQIAVLNLSRSVQADWKIIARPVQQVSVELFDVILCNPPYFEHEGLDAAVQRDARHQARFVYDLNVETMIEQAASRLKENGRFCFVHRPDVLGRAVCELERHGLFLSRLQIAYDARDRKAKAVLAEAVRSPQRKTQIEPPYWYGIRSERL